MICLDTNVVISAINRRTPAVRERLEKALVEGARMGFPVIGLFELHYGIMKSVRRRENAAALDRFLTLEIAILPFDPDDAAEAGDIRAALERAGTPIGPYDILIAAQARRRDAVLITANEREFGRVPGLKTEDWAATG